MSLDAEAMLEVNREAIYAAAKASRQDGQTRPLVLSVATFGRGIKQELLQQLEPYRRAWGHNQSLVATPPRAWVRDELGIDPVEAGDDGFQVIGYAFGKSCQRSWKWGDEEPGDLF